MKKIVFGFILLLIVGMVACCLVYYHQISPVSSDDTIIEFDIQSGSSFTSIADELKEKGLIRSELFYKLYIKLNRLDTLKVGTFELSPNMSITDIIDVITEAIAVDYPLTFREGLHMRQITEIMVENTNRTEEEVYAVLSDDAYLDELIDTYWFLTEDIKNPNLYYSLEGYLYPDTYRIASLDASVESILKLMLDNMEKKLESYKTQMEQSTYSVHELITLASMVELEASDASDRAGVAGVFYNRLNAGWSLGSDVTTYYAAKKEMKNGDLTVAELNDYNGYNTRNSNMAGKLPIGPICNPSISSIEATFNPTSSDYFYFVSDKNKKIYFNTTLIGHNNTIAQLKNEGLWYTYD